MNETNLKTGLRYVKFDHSHTRIRQAQFTYTADWRWEYVELLRRREYRAAENDASQRSDGRNQYILLHMAQAATEVLTEIESLTLDQVKPEKQK